MWQCESKWGMQRWGDGEPEKEESSKWGIYNSCPKHPSSLHPEHLDYKAKASFIQIKAQYSKYKPDI